MSKKTNKERSLMKSERASAPETTDMRRASITAEAAFGIPLFLFAVLCLIWIVEIQSIRISIKNAAQSAAKSSVEDIMILPVLNPMKLKANIVELIGEDRISRSILKGGSSGISCMKSYFLPDTGEMYITVDYEIQLPLPMFLNPSAEFEEKFKMNAWKGYKGSEENSGEDQIVYVADNGVVYHTDYNCSYLQLSIQCVTPEAVDSIRNISGSRYRPCEKCSGTAPYAAVYITESGASYHCSLSCSGLKRSVRAVKKSQVSWMGECSRCSE